MQSTAEPGPLKNCEGNPSMTCMHCGIVCLKERNILATQRHDDDANKYGRMAIRRQQSEIVHISRHSHTSRIELKRSGIGDVQIEPSSTETSKYVAVYISSDSTGTYELQGNTFLRFKAGSLKPAYGVDLEHT
ncbi:hypothetical protein MRB53_039594 [Persea americana]|nr:hypothetical protein MRB53_039594 [Persea americana]